MYLAVKVLMALKAWQRGRAPPMIDGNRDREVIKEMHLLHDLGFLLRCERIIAASS